MAILFLISNPCSVARGFERKVEKGVGSVYTLLHRAAGEYPPFAFTHTSDVERRRKNKSKKFTAPRL